MTESTSLEDLLSVIAAIDSHSIRYEIEHLRAIQEWAVKQACDFTVGDKVEMLDTLDLTSLKGWAPYAEVMAPGATATVMQIGYNEYHDYWYAGIKFDREWSYSPSYKGGVRYWNGPVSETPAGYEPPSKLIQEKYPEGRKHTFHMPVRHLRKIES